MFWALPLQGCVLAVTQLPYGLDSKADNSKSQFFTQNDHDNAIEYVVAYGYVPGKQGFHLGIYQTFRYLDQVSGPVKSIRSEQRTF
jgi:hypothetical protein